MKFYNETIKYLESVHLHTLNLLKYFKDAGCLAITMDDGQYEIKVCEFGHPMTLTEISELVEKVIKNAPEQYYYKLQISEVYGINYIALVRIN